LGRSTPTGPFRSRQCQILALVKAQDISAALYQQLLKPMAHAIIADPPKVALQMMLPANLLLNKERKAWREPGHPRSAVGLLDPVIGPTPRGF
jgi:hypothetical protein